VQYPIPRGFCSRFVRPGLLLLATVLAGCSQSVFETSSGQKIHPDQLAGQWVLVNYWAQWCQPCLEEIPELNRLDQNSDIVVLGVNFDGIQGEELEQLADRMGIDFTLLARDPGPEFGWDMPVGLPATFILDPDGHLKEVRFGAQTEASVRALIGD